VNESWGSSECLGLGTRRIVISVTFLTSRSSSFILLVGVGSAAMISSRGDASAHFVLMYRWSLRACSFLSALLMEFMITANVLKDT
jgi:hypothetical protein